MIERTGYLHTAYTQALNEMGLPRELPRSKGWILVRPIPGFPYSDAMGCYPLFTCQHWAQLFADLDQIGKEIVSLSLVTDPFGEYDEAYLRRCFEDVVIPFKAHYVIDLSKPVNTFVSQHHQRNTEKAFKNVVVEKCEEPAAHLDDWVGLYTQLMARHNIRGMASFSRESFARQLGVPGLVAFQALHANVPVGMLLWYVQGDVAYYHLGAFADTGYDLRASFALFWFAIEYFAEARLKWINLGAGAGVRGNASDGLSRFKRGWATETRMAYFCGRIFNHRRYEEIMETRTRKPLDTRYFPAYRDGEFV